MKRRSLPLFVVSLFVLTFSEAKFVYRLLFIPANKYEHRSNERWAGNCLQNFDARTNENGDRIKVSGERDGSNFVVERGDQPVELPECVMTFAYWNPDFLEQPRLLNPQTGCALPPDRIRGRPDVVVFAGRRVAGSRVGGQGQQHHSLRAVVI